MPKANATTTKKPAQRKGPVKKAAVINFSEGRDIKYPKDDDNIQVCRASKGTALTAEGAMQLLGWEVVAVRDDSVLFTDLTGAHIRCSNNAHNRPFDRATSEQYAQDILNRHWKYNHENIIIGETGLVISGQHRLIGLILAVQYWKGHGAQDESYHWKEKWPTEPTIDTSISFGCEETSDVIRTIDNVKPRSFADVLFTDGTFADKTPQERKELCGMLDNAVRLIWDRTGEKKDPYAPSRTHSEGCDFIARHPRVKDAVKYIWNENQPEKVNAGTDNEKTIRPIGRYIPPGTAAGLLYLMGTCGTDEADYRNAPVRSEKHVDFTHWDRAEEFWMLLGQTAKEMMEIRHAFTGLQSEDGEDKGTRAEKIAIMVKAWNVFVGGVNCYPTEEDLELLYKETEGGRVLNETPEVGGIDIAGQMSEAESKPAAGAAAGTPSANGTPGPADKPLNADAVEELRELREAHPDKVLLFRGPVNYTAFGSDADTVAGILGTKVVQRKGGTKMTSFPITEAAIAMMKLLKSKLKIATVAPGDKGRVIEDVKQAEKPTTKANPVQPVTPAKKPANPNRKLPVPRGRTPAAAAPVADEPAPTSDDADAPPDDAE